MGAGGSGRRSAPDVRGVREWPRALLPGRPRCFTLHKDVLACVVPLLLVVLRAWRGGGGAMARASPAPQLAQSHVPREVSV